MQAEESARVVHVHHAPPKDPTVAVLLEVLPGFFVQTFGIGHIYAGNTATGIALLLGYWILSGINFLLCLVVIGFITWPLTFLAFMILCPITAKQAAERANASARAVG